MIRERVLAVIVAAATFGVVNGAIVTVGLATAEPVQNVMAVAPVEQGSDMRAEAAPLRGRAPTIR